jgi:hypothetical protein
MILTAAIAIPLGVAVERRSRFSRLAAQHRSQIVECEEWGVHRRLGSEVNYRVFYCVDGEAVPWRRFRVARDLNEWHGLLAQKYERAAARPWLPVERDPPPPQ